MTNAPKNNQEKERMISEISMNNSDEESKNLHENRVQHNYLVSFGNEAFGPKKTLVASPISEFENQSLMSYK